MEPADIQKRSPEGKKFTIYTAVSIFLVMGITLLVVYVSYQSLNKPPQAFPTNVEIEIREGLSQKQIAHLLEDNAVVRSSTLLLYVLKHTQGDIFAKAGVYIFPEPLTTEEVAETLILGDQNIAYTKVTFPEGFSTKDWPLFVPEELEGAIEDLAQLEGYLFPDTYFLRRNASQEELISMMRENFEAKLASYENDIEASPFTRDELIILASLIEREAKDIESKRIVSGILQNRLAIGMPLQVDATFDYLLGKESSELTQDDLALDNPYNTYVYTGLPPGPIANPGLESIEAVLYPTTTDYMYYLTAPDGTFYYAETFEEHVENKRRYLR